jgi:hypothetical protein
LPLSRASDDAKSQDARVVIFGPSGVRGRGGDMVQAKDAHVG